jgi:hypothetical protein
MRTNLINRFTVTAATLLSVVTFAHAADLKNASFETAGDSPDTALNWDRWGQWMNRETAWTPAHGSSACMLGYHHWQIEDTNNSGVWQDISDVKPGQRFKFSVFVQIDKGDPGTNPVKEVELRLEATRNGSQLEIQSAKYTAANLPADGQWHQISVTGTTPESNLRVLIVASPADSAPRGGAVKFADASLDDVSNIPPAQ